LIPSPGRYVSSCNVHDIAERDAAQGLKDIAYVKLGMIRELIGAERDGKSALSEADGALVARDTPPTWISRPAPQRELHQRGSPPAPFTTIEAFPEGVDDEEAEKAYQTHLSTGKWPEGFGELEGFGFSGIFSAGPGARLEFEEGTLERGRVFLFRCFLPDLDGSPGESHEVEHGMHEIVTIR